MKLSDCYFVYGGEAYRFKVYSDKPTKARLHNVVDDGLGSKIEVYQIEPDAEAHWVVVSEHTNSYGAGKDGKQTFYVKSGPDFIETKELEALVFLREQVKLRSVRTRGRAA